MLLTLEETCVHFFGSACGISYGESCAVTDFSQGVVV
jgi:hypothetical protein